jgi:hypothetical protein
MRYKKKARKGVLHDVEKKLVALLRIISLVVLIIESLIGGAEFVKYKYEKAFPTRHTMSSELANPKKSHKKGGKPNRKRHRGAL